MATLWFCLAALVITGYVLLDGFDLGAGIVQLFVARAELETSQILKSIGPVWDGNEVWLIAAGGTLLFAFPVLLASAFSGFYLSLMITLWLLMLRGVAIEFRSHVDDGLWRSFWGAVFGVASSALALILGVALGNVVRGVPLDHDGYFFLPLWTNLSPKGQIGIIDWYTLLVGMTAFLALAVHGSLWVVLKTEGHLQKKTRSFGAKCWGGLAGVVLVMSIASFWIQPNLLAQFRNHPWGLVFPVSALAGLIGARVLSLRKRDLKAFLSSGFYLVGMLASLMFGVFPNVLPSSTAPDLSLTIYNSAAADHGLIIGLYWFIPGMILALLYSGLVYRHFSGKVK
jgi:cytochrome d ubiquinol oxidase subunit II